MEFEISEKSEYIGFPREIDWDNTNIFISRNFMENIWEYDFLLKVFFPIKYPTEIWFSWSEDYEEHNIFEDNLYEVFFEKHKLYLGISFQKAFKERIFYIFWKKISDFEKNLKKFILDNNYDLKFEIVTNKEEIEKNYKELYPTEEEIIHIDNNDIIESVFHDKLWDRRYEASNEELTEIMSETRNFIHYFYADTEEQIEQFYNYLNNSDLNIFKENFEWWNYEIESTYIEEDEDSEDKSFYSVTLSYNFNFYYIDYLTIFFKWAAEKFWLDYDLWECSI